MGSLYCVTWRDKLHSDPPPLPPTKNKKKKKDTKKEKKRKKKEMAFLSLLFLFCENCMYSFLSYWEHIKNKQVSLTSMHHFSPFF